MENKEEKSNSFLMNDIFFDERHITERKMITLVAEALCFLQPGLVLLMLFYWFLFHDATAVGTFSKYYLAFVPCAAARVVRGPVNNLLPYHGAPVLGIFGKIITGFVPCAAIRLVREVGLSGKSSK